jgi:truncated hemoglobin YjbI
MHDDLFDAVEARARRDTGLKRVGNNAHEFMEAGLAAIARLPKGLEYTGERIRALLLHQGIVPHHHNAWGALITVALKGGYLHSTGRYEAMQAKKSHARKTQVYVT